MMNRGTKVLATLAGVVFSASMITSLARAQAPGTPGAPGARGGGGGQRPGGRGGYGRPITLTRVSPALLKTSLKLSDDQVAKITAIHAKMADDQKALFAPPSDGTAPDPAARAANRQKMQAIDEQANTDILAVLDDTQRKAVPDLLKDMQVYAMAGIPMEAADQIKLTEDQKKQVHGIIVESNQKLRDATQAAAGDQDKINQARQDSRKDTRDKIQAVLTAEQKTALDDYRKAHSRRGGRRGGAGGPGAPAAPDAPGTQLL